MVLTDFFNSIRHPFYQIVTILYHIVNKMQALILKILLRPSVYLDLHRQKKVPGHMAGNFDV